MTFRPHGDANEGDNYSAQKQNYGIVVKKLQELRVEVENCLLPLRGL